MPVCTSAHREGHRLPTGGGYAPLSHHPAPWLGHRDDAYSEAAPDGLGEGAPSTGLPLKHWHPGLHLSAAMAPIAPTVLGRARRRALTLGLYPHPDDAAMLDGDGPAARLLRPRQAA